MNELDRQTNGCCRGRFTWREEGGCHFLLPLGKQVFFGGRWWTWRLWIKGPAGTSFPFGYRAQSEVEIRTNWCLSVPRSNVHPKQQTKVKEWVTMMWTPFWNWNRKQVVGQDGGRTAKSYRIWYGRCKELWTKGAAGSVDQQAVERHW